MAWDRAHRTAGIAKLARSQRIRPRLDVDRRFAKSVMLPARVA
jgi:hypothetical protein